MESVANLLWAGVPGNAVEERIALEYGVKLQRAVNEVFEQFVTDVDG